MSQQNRKHPFGEHVKSFKTRQSETRTLSKIQEIFGDKFDDDVIKLILEECDWKEADAVEKLCQLDADVVPTPVLSDPIGLDIIACDLLEQGDDDALPVQKHRREVSQEAVDSMQSHTDSHSEMTATGVEPRQFTSDMYMTYDYDKFDQAVDLPLLAAEDSVPFGSDFALSGRVQYAELGHQSDSDLQKDKQNLNSWTESKISPAKIESFQADSMFSEDRGLHFCQPTDLMHGLRMGRNEGPRFMGSSIASSSCDISVSLNSESLATTRTQMNAGGSTPVPAFSSRQQAHSSPVSFGDCTQSSETETKSCLRTGSIKSGTTACSNSANELTDMALSGNAPEFKPRFPPTPLSDFSPQPGFCMPRFSATFRLPNQSDPPVARMFGLKSLPHPQNGTFSRFVGPNLYLPAGQRFQSALGKQDGSTGSLNYSAAAQNSVLRAYPPPVASPSRSPRASDLSKKSPAVKTIERHILNGCKLLVLMRGLPGSGKSHLARQIQGDGQVFSTDDFFYQSGTDVYDYTPEKLSDAHAWNKKRVQKALDGGVTPVIVDNTNVTMWEMFPYAAMAYSRGYTIEVLEPDTPWSFQPKRLAKCNIHGVPIDSIRRMKDRYETVDTASLMAHVEKKLQKNLCSRTAAQPNDCKKKNPSSLAQAPLKPTAVQHPPSKPTQRPWKGAKKKAKRSSQKELTGIRDHCVKLQEEGAGEEEIEAWLFMANLMDSERLDIKNYLKSCKNNNNGKVSHGNVISGKKEDLGSKAFGKCSNGINSASNIAEKTQLNHEYGLPFGLNCASNIARMELSETAQLNDGETARLNDGYGLPACNITERNSDATDGTLPFKPSLDSLSQELPLLPGTRKQKKKRNRNTASKTVDSAAVLAAPREQALWENPKPQRRERPPRVSKRSESDKAGVQGKTALIDHGDDAELKDRSKRDVSEDSSSTSGTERQTASDGSSRSDVMVESKVVVGEERVALTGALSQEKGTGSARSAGSSTLKTNPSEAVGIEVEDVQASETADIRETGTDSVEVSDKTAPSKQEPGEIEVPKPVDMTAEAGVPKTVVDMTGETEVPKPVDMTGETKVHKPVDMTGETKVHTPVDMTGETEVHKPVDMTGETEVPKPVDVTGETEVPKPVDMTGETKVHTPVDMTGETEVHKPVDVTGETEVHKPVDMTGETEVRTPVDMTGETEVHKPVDITGETEVPKPVDVTGETEVRTPVDMTGETEVHKPVDMTGETEVPKPVDMTGETEVPKPVDMTGETEVPKAVDMTGETEVHKPVDMTGETEVHKPVDMTGETEVHKPIDMTRETEVPKAVDMTGETEVPKAVDMTGKTEVHKAVDMTGEAKQPEPVDIKDQTETPDTFDFEGLSVETSKNNEGAGGEVKASFTANVQKEKGGVERSVRLVVYSSSEEDECCEEDPSKSGVLTALHAVSAKKYTPESSSTDVPNSEHSRSSSLDKELACGVGAETSESSCPASPRRKVRRKKHRTPAIPFFDDSITVQLKSDSWKSFGPERQIPDHNAGMGREVVEAQTSLATTTPDCPSISTQTEGRDFGAVSKGVAYPPQKAEDGYRFLVASEDYVCAASTGAAIPSSKSHSQKLKLDKSTTVDITCQPSADWLYSCFPGVAVAHLNEVLEVCHGDVGMAVELMFEWGISNPITPHDKHQLQKEMAKHRSQAESSSPRMPEAAAWEGKNERISAPPTLMDLCMNLVPQTNIDIQQQVINSSEQRLQRIESTESQRIRSISFEEIHSDVDTGIDLSDHFSLDLFTSSASSERLHDVRWKPQPKVPSSESSKESSERSSVEDFPSVLAGEVLAEPQNEGRRPERVLGSYTSSSLPVASASDSALPDSEAQLVQGDLALPLPAGLVRNLEELFGTLPIPNKGAASLTVNLDHITAHHLYQCLAQSLSTQFVGSEDERTRQLREDEALAQWLQDEEEVDRTLEGIALATPQTTKFSPYSWQQRAPVSGSHFGVRSQQAPHHFRPGSKPVNLQDIMDEEMDKQRKHEKQAKMLEATGDHIAIATKLKREKLQQHFPGIDERFLEEIFQSNGYCLETTVSVIEGALGGKQPVSHKLEMPSTRGDTHSLTSTAGRAAQQWGFGDVCSSEETGEQYQRVDAWDSLDLDYQELRREASVHHYMRRDCFTKAQEAHHRGMKDVASFYSQKAQNHFKMMKEANMRASEKMLETRQDKLDQEMTLDLHGLHVDEAVAALKRVIEEKEKEFQQKPVLNRKHLYVITGRGRHSQHGVARIRPAVAAYLDSADYRFVENKPGQLKVALHPPV